MRKKLVYIGIALVVVGIAIFLSSGQMLGNAVGRNSSYLNVTVTAGRATYVNISTENTSALLLTVGADSATNMYVMNRTSFDEWGGGTGANTSSISDFAAANPSGVERSYADTKMMELVLAQNVSGMGGSGMANVSYEGIFPGSVYVVLQYLSAPGQSERAGVLYVPFTSDSLQSYKSVGMKLLVLGMVSFAAFIGGIAMVGYGVLKHGPEQGGEQVQELPVPGGKLSKDYIDSLYKGIDKREKRKRSRRKAR